MTEPMNASSVRDAVFAENNCNLTVLLRIRRSLLLEAEGDLEIEGEAKDAREGSGSRSTVSDGLASMSTMGSVGG